MLIAEDKRRPSLSAVAGKEWRERKFPNAARRNWWGKSGPAPPRACRRYRLWKPQPFPTPVETCGFDAEVDRLRRQVLHRGALFSTMGSGAKLTRCHIPELLFIAALGLRLLPAQGHPAAQLAANGKLTSNRQIKKRKKCVLWMDAEATASWGSIQKRKKYFPIFSPNLIVCYYGFLLFDFNLNRQSYIMIQFDTKQYNMIQYSLIWFILFVPTSWAFNATCIFWS